MHRHKYLNDIFYKKLREKTTPSEFILNLVEFLEEDGEDEIEINDKNKNNNDD